MSCTVHESNVGLISDGTRGQDSVALVGFEELGDEIVNGQLEATTALKKWSDIVRDVKILELKKHTYKEMVDRYAIVGSEAGNTKVLQCIVTKVQTRKQTGTLSLSLYKAAMYLECSPFLEKGRDGGEANSTDVSVCCLLYLVIRKMPLCCNALYL